MQSRACKMLDFSVPIDPPVHGTLPSLTLTLTMSVLKKEERGEMSARARRETSKQKQKTAIEEGPATRFPL